MDSNVATDITAEPPGEAGVDGDFATLFAHALAHHREGNLRHAQNIYLRLMTLARDVDDAANVLTNLGALLKSRGQLDQAIEALQRSIALRADNPIAYCNLARIFAQQGESGDAETCYRQAIRLDGTSGEAHYGLAVLLWQHGERSDAAKLLRLAAQLSPDFPDTWYMLGTLLCEDGECDEAIRCLERYLELDPQDACGAAIKLSQLGAVNAPAATPQRHLIEYYQSRAADWDQRARLPNAYSGIEILHRAIVEFAGSRRFARVLDIGCGTGLCGEFLRPMSDMLDGVDLSPQMLAQAGEKGLYNSLRRGDLENDLRAHPASYDLVVGAAVLIHFLDLAPVFHAVFAALRPGGGFAFTLFRDDGDEPTPTATSFFAHSHGYVATQAAIAGFVIRQIEPAVHEYRDGKPRPGWVVVLERPVLP